MEQQIQQGQQWLEEVLRLMGTPAKVSASQPDEQADPKGYWLTIEESELTPTQVKLLTGERGETLDALQYLANTTLNLGRSEAEQRAFTIELAGYRLRRQEELRQLAEQVARQVRESGEEVEMKSLSSAERRQVHNLLKNYEDLETYSRGQEPDRRLTVRLRV